MEYATYLGGSGEDAAAAVALARSGDLVYVGGYTDSPDFPIRGPAVESQLNGSRNGFLSAIDIRSGKLVYSTYLGGTGRDWVTGIATAPDGTVYVSGVTQSKTWPGIRLRQFGKLGAADGFIIRLDPAGKQRATGIRIGGRKDDDLAAIALDSDGDIYAAGTTASPDFPVIGAHRGRTGSGFVLKINGRQFGEGQTGVVWSRRLGGQGDDAILSVSEGMPGVVFVAGRSGSKDFPATNGAIYGRLKAANDSTLMELRASDGQIQFATFVGGTRIDASWYNDEAHGVVANANGDVYVTGCTLDNMLPVTPGAFQPRPRGNSEPFVLRMRFAVSN